MLSGECKWTLVKIQAWCRQTISRHLNQYWPISMSSYGVSRPRWLELKSQQNYTFSQNELIQKCCYFTIFRKHIQHWNTFSSTRINCCKTLLVSNCLKSFQNDSEPNRPNLFLSHRYHNRIHTNLWQIYIVMNWLIYIHVLSQKIHANTSHLAGAIHATMDIKHLPMAGSMFRAVRILAATEQREISLLFNIHADYVNRAEYPHRLRNPRRSEDCRCGLQQWPLSCVLFNCLVSFTQFKFSELKIH